eukprot:15480835-Alexandrium_andersonii.AAC.1
MHSTHHTAISECSPWLALLRKRGESTPSPRELIHSLSGAGGALALLDPGVRPVVLGTSQTVKQHAPQATCSHDVRARAR